MYELNENAPQSFAIEEASEFEKQEHYVTVGEKSCSGRLQRKYSFRLWHILLFLFVVAAIIVLVSLLSRGVLRGKKAAASNDGKTAKILSTKRPDVECGVVIVGGGVGGLLLAYMLLEKKIERNVCIFEKENRLGGKIYDHFFSEAPDISVGLGQLLVLGNNVDERRVLEDLLNYYSLLAWERSLTRVEARGVFADDFDKLQQNAFPTLNRSDTVKEMADSVTKANSSLYSTAGDFLSDYLSPEGRELLGDAYCLNYRLYDVNPESYKKYLREKRLDEEDRGLDKRPEKGLSQLIELLKDKVNKLKGSIYFPETVTSVMKKGSKFFLQTTNRTVRANKTVLTVGPPALKDMTGDVMQNITNHKILRSIVSVPAFFGAAVYQNPWWEDSKAVKRMSDKNMFISRSNCLGITMPYEKSKNGNGVLQTIANTGSCSDMWGSKLKISKDVVDREMKRALEYKFQRNIPDALSTFYKYWQNGFWYLQKAGTNFSLKEIRDWAKRPLPGSDVFLVGKAFYNFGGWLEDTIKSTNETLVEGWKTELPL
ncbi:L-amino-acid oxidase-like [Acropora muricata]|uniref:L-amino-acid oxidase-like n=1 Tax=Acropora muricata TaxID=159855 RepID=UPI0034E39C97